MKIYFWLLSVSFVSFFLCASEAGTVASGTNLKSEIEYVHKDIGWLDDHIAIIISRDVNLGELLTHIKYDSIEFSVDENEVIRLVIYDYKVRQGVLVDRHGEVEPVFEGSFDKEQLRIKSAGKALPAVTVGNQVVKTEKEITFGRITPRTAYAPISHSVLLLVNRGGGVRVNYGGKVIPLKSVVFEKGSDEYFLMWEFLTSVEHARKAYEKLTTARQGNTAVESRHSTIEPADTE